MFRSRLAALLLVGCLTTKLCFGALPDPAAQAADYYFSHYDYAQAFSLWSAVYGKQPDSAVALLRLSELRLMFEGRPAVARGILDYLNAHALTVTRENRRALKDKLANLQSAFLTDDGQALFLQGLARSRAGDCAAAMPFFSQADRLEKGNLRILREEASCELRTGAFDRNYASLKRAHELEPFDSEVLDGLAESFLYYGENQKVLELFPGDSESPRTLRARTAQAVALSRSGATAPATLLLQELVDEPAKDLSPIVYFELGRVNAERAEKRAHAIENLKAFLSKVPAEPPAWDPYHLMDRAAEARTLLTQLKTR